jgi:hypothetical protein
MQVYLVVNMEVEGMETEEVRNERRWKRTKVG